MAIKELYAPADCGTMDPLLLDHYYNFGFKLEASSSVANDYMAEWGGVWTFKTQVPVSPGVYDLSGLSSLDDYHPEEEETSFASAFSSAFRTATYPAGIGLVWREYDETLAASAINVHMFRSSKATKYFHDAVDWGNTPNANLQLLSPELLTCDIDFTYPKGSFAVSHSDDTDIIVNPKGVPTSYSVYDIPYALDFHARLRFIPNPETGEFSWSILEGTLELTD